MKLHACRVLLLVGCLPACTRIVHPGDTVGLGPATPGDREGLTFFALGDAGWATPKKRLHDVARLMEKRAQSLEPAFVLLLGDNFYPTGVRSVDDPQWRTTFEDVYRGSLAETPFYAALGNHDYLGDVDAQVAYTKKGGRWNMPARHYQFQHALPGGTHLDVFVLDTDPLVEQEKGWADQLAWLAKALAESEAAWKVVAGHHPVRSGGRHGNEQLLIQRLEPLFTRHRVALYLSGHDHDMELLRLPGGTLQIVSGTGSDVRETSWGPLTMFAAAEHGFTAVTLGTDELWVEFHDIQDRVLYRHAEPRPQRDGAQALGTGR